MTTTTSSSCARADVTRMWDEQEVNKLSVSDTGARALELLGTKLDMRWGKFFDSF